MGKINVSLPEELLERMDQAARESGLSRSAFVVEALRHFLEEEGRKREKRRKAAAGMDHLREEFGGWDSTAEILKWRDNH